MTGRDGRGVQKDGMYGEHRRNANGNGAGCDYFSIGKFWIAGRNFCEN